MTLTRMDQLDLEELGAIVSALGNPNFYRQLMRFIGRVVMADVEMVMRYARSTAPSYVVHDNLDRGLMQAYLDGLYRIDPVYRLCKGPVSPGVFTLETIDSTDRIRGQYSKKFLSQAGMEDDLIILFPAPGSSTIALIFERSRAFTSDELKTLQPLYPLLAGMQSAHERMQISLMVAGGEFNELAYRILDSDGKILFDSARWSQVFAKQPLLASQIDRLRPNGAQSIVLEREFIVKSHPLMDQYAAAPNGTVLTLERGAEGMSPVSPLDAVEFLTDTVLTPRERDIVKLILRGMPNAKIAEHLGLSLNTIKNHRKRLYLKLDITTERELLLKLLGSVGD